MEKKIEVFFCPLCNSVYHHRDWKKNEGALKTHLQNNKDRWTPIAKICDYCQESEVYTNT